jgi:hypothetical protein
VWKAVLNEAEFPDNQSVRSIPDARGILPPHYEAANQTQILLLAMNALSIKKQRSLIITQLCALSRSGWAGALPCDYEPLERALRDLGGPPWRCKSCRRLNTNDRQRCKQCQHERRAQ